MERKLYEALSTIKAECAEHGNCYHCPLYQETGESNCFLYETEDAIPYQWDLESLSVTD